MCLLKPVINLPFYIIPSHTKLTPLAQRRGFRAGDNCHLWPGDQYTSVYLYVYDWAGIRGLVTKVRNIGITAA